jgi:hypothetical protein
MSSLQGRRRIALIGTGLALVAGLGIAALLIMRDHQPNEAPPASQGGLIVQSGRDDDIKLDPRRPLRCFVKGQLVGELPLSDCARQNGVASGALDVGLDPSGALSATTGASNQITPLPPQDETASADQGMPAGEPPALAAPTRIAGCWRYGEGDWSRMAGDLSLGACVANLYGGICSQGGPPAYGRWGDRTLRLVEGRIEISADNRNFRVLADRNPGCPPQPVQ